MDNILYNSGISGLSDFDVNQNPSLRDPALFATDFSLQGLDLAPKDPRSWPFRRWFRPFRLTRCKNPDLDHADPSLGPRSYPMRPRSWLIRTNGKVSTVFERTFLRNCYPVSHLFYLARPGGVRAPLRRWPYTAFRSTTLFFFSFLFQQKTVVFPPSRIVSWMRFVVQRWRHLSCRVNSWDVKPNVT